MASVQIEWLRHFVQVVLRGGFSHAAEELGRSPETIALTVKRLEEELSVRLFRRSQTPSLTSAGKVCFAFSQQILSLHDEMIVAMRAA
jgi:DNA-binding transcriptional LysR family regulator